MFMATVLNAAPCAQLVGAQGVRYQGLSHRHLAKTDHAHHQRDREDVPDLQPAGEDQGQHQDAHGTHDEFHGGEQTVARQPVGQGAGEQGQEVERHPRGGDSAHQKRRVGQGEDEPAQHRGLHLGADAHQGGGTPDKGKVAVPENAQRGGSAVERGGDSHWLPKYGSKGATPVRTGPHMNGYRHTGERVSEVGAASPALDSGFRLTICVVRPGCAVRPLVPACGALGWPMIP